MKKHAGLIKNLIMVVASALTLVAVSFAWFTSNFKTNLDQYKVAVEGNPIKVDFYQLDENNEYKPLAGNIELNDFVPGEYNQYKLLVTTKTSDKLKMSFSIDGIPADIPQELKDNVCIKYSVQASGLRCLMSDSICDEVVVTKLVKTMSIEEMPEAWADIILQTKDYERFSHVEAMQRAGFDVRCQAETMMKFYETGIWK